MEKNTALLLILHKRIETERLLLRPVTIEDAEDMYEYASDEETAYYVFDKHQSLEDTKENIAAFLRRIL